MTAMTDYLEGQIIDHVFRTANFAKPTDLTVHLYTAAPTDAGGGTEVAGGAYAAVSVPPLDANWAAPVGGNGVTSNIAAVTFPAPTANWGQVVAWAILDQAANMLIHHTMATPKTVNSGDPAPKFDPNALQLTFD